MGFEGFFRKGWGPVINRGWVRILAGELKRELMLRGLPSVNIRRSAKEKPVILWMPSISRYPLQFRQSRSFSQFLFLMPWTNFIFQIYPIFRKSALTGGRIG